jgi:hypothetical protein
MKLKRTDLSLNLCSPQFDDTYLFPPLFQYLSDVNNITIFYNCSSFEESTQFRPNIQSLCGSKNYAFCQVSSHEKFMEEAWNCNRHIQVPIGADFPVDKKADYYYYERDVLESGLDKGFEVKYSVNEDCLGCLGDEVGVCFNDYVESSCYYDNCPNGSFASSGHCSPLHRGMFSYLFMVCLISQIN